MGAHSPPTPTPDPSPNFRSVGRLVKRFAGIDPADTVTRPDILHIPFYRNLESPTAKRPNFVFFPVDNLGYVDVGTYKLDTPYGTPNSDRIAV